MKFNCILNHKRILILWTNIKDPDIKILIILEILSKKSDFIKVLIFQLRFNEN